jgi:3-hydroxyisobutyrate dehydrogenase-like beta-hydroxyacid dehydrogenase
MKIAFLGLGKMGSAIAGRLLQSGHSLTVWNRTTGTADVLAADGAEIALSAHAAILHADVIFTMLNDDAAVEQVILGGDGQAGILDELAPSAIHVSLSTISVALSRTLTAKHAAAGSRFVASPVFGRPNVATDGKLWLAVAGRDKDVAYVRPLLESFSREITVISKEPWQAHALKIGGNFLITAMIESLGEAMAFSEAHSIDPELFLEIVNNALFRSPFYEAYGKVMLHPPKQPGATIALGAKDMKLFRDAAQNLGMITPLADRFADDLAAASEAGLKDTDWAAGLYQFAKSSKLTQ